MSAVYGALGAALIAGLVSILGLVIAKEQKISEFRHAWIGDLQKSIVAYLENLNAICDVVRTNASQQDASLPILMPLYKALNVASNSIKLSINPSEPAAAAVLEALDEFEALAGADANLQPEPIRSIEKKFLASSRVLMKGEWKRVKRGELTFVIAKWSSVGAVILLALAMALLILKGTRTIEEVSCLHLSLLETQKIVCWK
jgi:hypothetical protein